MPAKLLCIHGGMTPLTVSTTDSGEVWMIIIILHLPYTSASLREMDTTGMAGLVELGRVPCWPLTFPDEVSTDRLSKETETKRARRDICSCSADTGHAGRDV